MQAIKPWVAPGGRPGSAQGPPDGTVALEARAEGELPDPIATAHELLGLEVGELVPYGAAGGVAEAMQRHPRRLHVAVPEPQVLLQLVQHALARCVHAQVLERQLVVRYVQLQLLLHRPGPRLHSSPNQMPPRERHEEDELLREGQDKWAKRRDVGFESLPAHFHHVPADGQTLDPLFVFLLIYRSIRQIQMNGW